TRQIGFPPLSPREFAGPLLASASLVLSRRQHERKTDHYALGHRHRNCGGADARSCPGPAFARSTRGHAQAEPGRKPEKTSSVRVDRDHGHQLEGRREVAQTTAGLLRRRWKADESSDG